jgi:uncharacterized protein
MIPKMTWQVVQFKDVLPTPWRNGGGSTRELVAWPESAAWRWRASVAEVTQSGPFSDFAGVQRWFAVLKGDGVCLTVDGYMHMLSKSDQPLAFDGAVPTSCELLGGATQDFNLMVQDGTSARMQRVFGSYQTTTSTPKIIAACAHSKGARVQIGTEKHVLQPHSFGWAHVDAGVAIHARSHDVLLMEIEV